MSSPDKPLFTRRTSTLTTIGSSCSDEEEEEKVDGGFESGGASASGGSLKKQKQEEDAWRPPSLTPSFHSWNADNVARIVHTEWHLDNKQQARLQEFHEATRHINHWKNSPYTALQFLKEWRWKVPAAVAAFERMLTWRQMHGVDGIADVSSSRYYQPPDDYNYFPQAILQGTDRQGNPIYVERTGTTYLWDLFHRHGHEETVRASTWIREKCTTGEWVAAWEARAGRGLSGTTAIVDLQGLSRKHASWSVMQAVKDGTKIIQANWPCEANRVIIIRAPALFRYVWSFLKPFLTETVKELITICTAADPLPELAEFLDLNVLPPCINPDGHGEAWPEFGPIVWEGGPLPPPSSSLVNEKGTKFSRKLTARSTTSISTDSVTSSSKASVSVPTASSRRQRQRPRRSNPQSSSPKSVMSLGVGGF